MGDVLPSGQTRRLVLHGTDGVVRRCREFSREALADWEWIPAADARDRERQAVVDDVLLLVSEVVTNACLHADGPQEIVLRCSGDRLRIEVTDDSPVHPRPRPAGAAEPGGYGLIVLKWLARRWGSVSRERGKTVWVEVASPHGRR